MLKPYSYLLCGIAIIIALQASYAQNKLNSKERLSNPNDQKTLEKQFDQLLEAKSIGANIRQLSAEPHHLGSAGDKRVAEAVLAKFKEYGWEASIETYKVLFPTPKMRILELLSPAHYTAGLQELAVPEDSTSGQEGQLPTYVAWSADGDVTADLVYVNFGLPNDYEQLDRLGISVKGKIVIARYGNSWRGIKPKIAFEHGAVGCIIYSDPKEDGYYQGDQYPKGAFKNETMVQRGSVMDMVVYPGDPLTPNIGATENAKRLSRDEAPTILKIPVLPISYQDALPLLSALEGHVVPAEWRGALPVTYKVGGTGRVKVHLKTEFNWDLVPAYNIIAKIKGSESPDQWIIRGNHHDAWVNGADDPVSALAALLEEAKAIGKLAKSGYKPKRTIVYCVWDGEEPSLLGSTEWVEDHYTELKNKAIAYINTDGNSRGFLNAGGSHAFKQFVTAIAKDVKDPQTGASVFDRQRAEKAVLARNPKQKKEEIQKTSLSLEALGTGSDYSAFLQHAGIPTLSFEFGGEGSGGEYHSIFDSYNHYVRFKDPDFSYGVALAQVVGRSVLRLADTSLLPFDYRSLYKAIHSFADEIKTFAEQSKEETETNNLLVNSGAYKLADDPQKKLNPPAIKDTVPIFDFSALNASLDTLGKLSDSLFVLQTKLANLTDKRKDKLNELLFQAEKSLLIENGLPRRPWYKHSIYAPGFYTGYGAKTLPGIREAIEERHWKEANEQIVIATKAIRRLNSTISSAIEIAISIH
jgi:N-acetylated-alpha-linked acidic dipeptidase